MVKREDLQTHCQVEVAPLSAHQYRVLWLETAAELGLVAECLAEALDWVAPSDTTLPDPIELANEAARRIKGRTMLRPDEVIWQLRARAHCYTS